MQSIIAVLVVCLLSLPLQLFAAEDPLEQDDRTTTLDFILENAIAHQLIAGGVVVIGNSDGILYSTARGRLNANADAPYLSERTVFDVASLTKVFATTPAIMKLLEDGQISLMDPLTRWFPEFAGSGREDITILNLLTHTSGLEDIPLGDASIITAVQKTPPHKKWKLPGSSFRYADINFMLLGELVRRVSGKSLDAFCREQLYKPLDMQSTTFLPGPELAGTIAPTYAGAALGMTSGMVQDENARKLGGIAGHAGLFSSAWDLARFSRMLLNSGILDNRRIFSERVVTQMTAPYFYSNGAIVRGLGWDIESPFSAPRGSFFSKMSFGHTGYSGSSIWIDPQRDLFVVLLTTRLDYRNKQLFNRLRSDISTLAVAAFWPTGKGRIRSSP